MDTTAVVSAIRADGTNGWIARQGALGWRMLDKELAQEEKKQQENANPITKKEEIKNQTLNKDKALSLFKMPYQDTSTDVSSIRPDGTTY